MKIEIYKIIPRGWNKKSNIDYSNLYNELKDSPVYSDPEEWKFAIVQVYENKNFIYGLLGQESNEPLFEYDDEKNKIELGTYRWYETFFAIDKDKLDLYVHKLKYKPQNLNPSKTIKRLQIILNIAFFNICKQKIVIKNYREGLNQKEYKKVFYGNKILEVKFTQIAGHYIPEGIKLHNPNKPLDEIRILSHNTYDADILSNALLEAERGRDLSKSPTARALLESGSKGEKIKYENDKGEIITEYSETKAFIDMSEEFDKSNVHSVIENLKKYKERNAKRISKFKLFNEEDLFYFGEEENYED